MTLSDSPTFHLPVCRLSVTKADPEGGTGGVDMPGKSQVAIASFVDHFCYLCFMSGMLSCLFFAALWSPAGRGLASWLLCVMFSWILLLSNVVAWVRFGTWLYRFMIFAFFLTFLRKSGMDPTSRSNWTQLGPIASRGRSVQPSVKYVVD